MYFKNTIQVITLLVLFSGNCIAIKLTENSVVTARVVTAVNASEAEIHAANLLCEYLDKMVNLPVGTTRPITLGKLESSEKNIVLVGRAKSFEKIRISLNQSENNGIRDLFVIKTTRDNYINYLLLCGANDRSVNYAVTHFLETFGKVGVFWDGEYVPKRSDWSVDNIDIDEKAFFPVRQYMQYCPYVYNYMFFWDFAKSKRHLDWAVWKKQSRLLWPTEEHLKFYAQQARDRFHTLGTMEAKKFEGYCGKIMEESVNYGREKLGLEFVYTLLDPNSDLEYNPDHVYAYSFPSEHLVRDLSDEQRGKEFQKYVDEARGRIGKVDEQGIWYAPGWGLYDPGMSNEAAKQVFESIGDARFYVSDMWAEYGNVYDKYDYFYGREWLFGILHSYGGWTALFGDAGKLAADLKRIAADPKAKNCIGTYINPEVLFYNTFYFELAAKLSWNPDKVELDEFITEYCMLRYGEESAAEMTKAYKHLLASVYSCQSAALPYREKYWDDPINWAAYEPTFPYWSKRIPGELSAISIAGQKNINHLIMAAKIMLSQGANQKGNELYAHDLVEVTLQLVRESFNGHLFNLYTAFIAGDRERFEESQKAVKTCLECVKELLSSRNEYRIKPEIDKIMNFDGVTEGVRKDIETYIKYDAYTWAENPFLRDYQRQEKLELFEKYQRPRTEAYLAYIQNKFKKGEKGINSADLEKKYKKIENAWLTNSLPRPSKNKAYIEAVKNTLKQLKIFSDLLDIDNADIRINSAESLKLISKDDGNISLQIDSQSNTAIEVEAAWNNEGDNGWSISPKSIKLNVQPGEKKEVEFKLDNKQIKNMFPLPFCDVIIKSENFKSVARRLPLSGKTLNTFLAAHKPEIGCRYTKRSPVIDGKLEDEIWQREADVCDFTDARMDRMPLVPTYAWLSFDENNIYIAIKCVETDMSDIKTDVKDHDGMVWLNDSVEFFIDSNLDMKTYHQFIVTAGGAIYEGYGWDKTYEDLWQYAVDRNKDCWSVEFAIPWKSLGVNAPEDKQKAGILLARNRKPVIPFSDQIYRWPPTIITSHRPDLFAIVNFCYD